MDILNFAVQLATLISIIGGVLSFAGDKERRAEEDNRRKQEDKRKAQQATIEAFQSLQNNVLFVIDMKKPSDVAKCTEDPRSDGYKEFRNLLMQVDCFCVGLNEGIYDFEVFFEWAKDYFNSPRGSLRPTMERYLEKVNAGKQPGSRYFENIYKVWDRMDRGRSTQI